MKSCDCFLLLVAPLTEGEWVGKNGLATLTQTILINIAITSLRYEACKVLLRLWFLFLKLSNYLNTSPSI
jgi:hypothetical protein